MITYALTYAIGCFGLALLISLFRLLRAPGFPDRILALDTLVVNMIALIVLYGILQASGINFEAAMLFAITGFVSTIAFCKYLLRGDIIE
ncbi:K+/H+ antiporter subunit F [Paracoccaceae bacterium Fryx2]|nr:K+/H+ antiporter subunit F [Paracoccaceae bacterium Fryx2]